MNRLVIGTVDIVIHAFCLEEVSQERKLPRGHAFQEIRDITETGGKTGKPEKEKHT